ncbi:phytanoyl-CoA dioxygenase family protein [Sphingobium sp.]|uniref:phytanoyl-CoA dioxygenase family protein n=1 Tax=Sphingobium sp. TaxID=1912891 RepID=UPI0028BF42C6|nr:phytanoyl-CoA dioxygenase family protein [Sphingobium sp.]
MITSSFADTLPMRELTVSNHLLDDPVALQNAWDRDGYWFFRDVLDKDAVGRLRAVYLDVLNGLGVIDPTRTDAAVHNGASLDDFPIRNDGSPETDPLMARYPRDQFVAEPAIRAFFERLFGEEVFWVPNTEYHALPPRPEKPGKRFNFLHCDGPNNKGLPLKICWMPLAPIDEATGGLALAEGMHKPRMNDFARPPQGIADNVIPEESWRRALYQPGDLLVFSLQTPHSGLANRSDRYFRLSMDIRGMPRSGNIPTVGKVAAIDSCAITVTTDEGEDRTFRIDGDTFCRITRGRLTGMPLALEEIPQLVKIGAPVYVASDHGTATFIRPQH